MVAAEGDRVLRVAGTQGELRRRLGDRGLHHLGVEPHDEVVDHAPGVGEVAPGPRIEDAHPGGCQQLQRRTVDVFDLIGRQHFHRPIRVAQRGEWLWRRAGRLAPGAGSVEAAHRRLLSAPR
jgi:hypothetical protein